MIIYHNIIELHMLVWTLPSLTW